MLKSPKGEFMARIASYVHVVFVSRLMFLPDAIGVRRISRSGRIWLRMGAQLGTPNAEHTSTPPKGGWQAAAQGDSSAPLLALRRRADAAFSFPRFEFRAWRLVSRVIHTAAAPLN